MVLWRESYIGIVKGTISRHAPKMVQKLQLNIQAVKATINFINY
jgi:hypothetical protein